MLIYNQIKLGIFIPFEIPSILCHIFLIYHLTLNRQLRQALHNHVILIFLIINFLLITIDLSMIFNYLRNDGIEENSVNYCLAWNFIDSFLTNLSSFLMMWASLERHLLIFHDRQIYNNHLKRVIFHYFPIIILIIYTFIFYFIVIIIYPYCSSSEHFHYDEVFCGRPCYVHSDIILSSFDLIINRVLCSIGILIFSSSLFIRVLYAKKKRNQIIRWRKHKRMMIQLVSISTLYLIGALPPAIGELLHIFDHNNSHEEESAVQEEIFLYLVYFISLIIPFICLISLPEVYMKIPFLSRFIRPINAVSPVTHLARQNQGGTTHLHAQSKTVQPN